MESAIYNGLKDVRLLDGSLGEGNNGAVAISPVSKIPDLEEKINAFLRAIRSDGTMDDIAWRWLVMRDETMPEIPPTEASGLHLVVGTTGISMPFSYYIGTELAYRFAAWLGAGLEFKVYD